MIIHEGGRCPMAVLEDYGYGDTNTAPINRVARQLAKSDNNVIENEEFIRACMNCDVDPYSFTQKDLDELQSKLNQIT